MESDVGTIFLSYAREDEEIAAKLYHDLSDAGLSIWFDKISLRPGQRWKPTIKKAIRECRHFIALLSSNSVSKKGYVQKELYEALEILDEYPESETFIIPVRMENCEPSHSRLRDLQWVDLFPSYQKGITELLSIFSAKQTNMTVAILQEANEVEVANAVDVANAAQTSFKFNLYSKIIQFDKSAYEFTNGAIDFDNAIDDIVEQQKHVQELLTSKPVLITSLPYSDKKTLEEYSGKPITDELSQCYFHEIFEYPAGNISLISTFIWDHLTANSAINVRTSPSGRRALQPYLLFQFASIILDPLADLPFHEETRGCPFDYCSDVQDIDEAFRVQKICKEHEDFLQREVIKAHITKEQIESAIRLFNRAFGKVT
jgi:hypothetical protein